ncbi:MAG: DUF1576 domain-containing protein [Anaeroplasmataceae bacterium]
MTFIFSYLRKTMYMPILAIVFLILSFCFSNPIDMFKGYGQILISPSVLITDYIAVGGIGAAFFNVFTVMLFNLILIKLFDLRFSGIIFAGFLCVVGFSFFGKNILNTLPIYMGIYFYSLFKKIPYKTLIITILFSTGISPLVSYCMFGFGFELYWAIPLGIICGLVAGLIIAPISNHTIKFHQGYNLYNTGFALGLISLLFYGLFSSFGLEVNTQILVSTDSHVTLLVLLIAISISFILISLLLNYKAITKYPKMLKRSGRLISDFIRDFDRDLVLMNCGILGLACALIVLIFNINLNGAIFGTIMTVIGFGASGIHIKNLIPVVLGAILCVFLVGRDITETPVIISVFFVSALAPIAGRYGIIIGVISGFIHVLLVNLMLPFQGGFDLYNNGFCAGFVACIIIVTVEALKKGDSE